MGRSDPVNKPVIYKYLKEISKEGKNISILDLGMGSGEFGLLVRSIFCDKARLEGVEVWTKYKNPLWELYDKIIISDLTKIKIKQYDIILFIDVLEHLDRDEGERILDMIEQKATKAIVISTPTSLFPQGKLWGNPYETHKYFWDESELIRRGYKCLLSTQVQTFVEHPKKARLSVLVKEK